MPRWGRRREGNGKRTILLLLLALLLAGAAALWFAFRNLMTEMAVSSARDAVILSVNGIVKDVMNEEDLEPEGLVKLEKSLDGSVTAVSTDVAAVNTLAARVLERVVAETAENVITVDLPVGNLMGSALFLGKGPSVPVEVLMLSSSVAGFRSEMTAAGINQTRHRILLELKVDVSLLMPWRTINDRVDTEILVSETVIVGAVPESYVEWNH